MELTDILHAYGLANEQTGVEPFGTGLINHTWKISCPATAKEYILQRINTAVFKKPEAIASNIKAIAGYLQQRYPDYLFVTPIKTLTGEEMYFDGDAGYYRVFPFLRESQSFDVVSSPSEAYEAAQQFAQFTHLLAGFNTGALAITLPDFHNLSLRFEQFVHALNHGNEQRIKESGDIIYHLLEHKPIVDVFEQIKHNPDFRTRVMHHDTKISNILFDKDKKGLCVIDLDTVMPGYFISDVGDMMRTYLSPVSEEESDISRIEVRDDYFFAIVDGYFSKMGEELTEAERAHFVYAGKFMIYMQALRFLTDHINNDVYYGARYEGHNLVRAKNQLVLLQKLIEKEALLLRYVEGVSVTAG